MMKRPTAYYFAHIGILFSVLVIRGVWSADDEPLSSANNNTAGKRDIGTFLWITDAHLDNYYGTTKLWSMGGTCPVI